MDSFVIWCKHNHLQLNVIKTKDMIVDPVSIQGVDVDMVEDHKYLKVHTDNKLDWVKNKCTVQEGPEP